MGLFDIFSTGPADQAAQSQISGIKTGVSEAIPWYQQGVNALTSNFGQAVQPFQSLLRTAGSGVDALKTALGIGPGGPGAVQAAVVGNPAYQFQLGQGNNAINAEAAATGKLNSGNTAIDLSKFNQGLAGSSYQQYIQNLMPFLNTATTAAGGIGNIFTGLGTNLNNAYGNLGNLMYGANTSIGNAEANKDLAAYNASGNIWNLLGAGAKLGMTAIPGLGGAPGTSLFGGLGSGLSSLGSGLMSFLSDEKVKEDIQPVGALADGQTVYRYRYKGDPRTQIGLIAQEVEQTDPGAVSDMLPGIKGVDYRVATERAAALMAFAKDSPERMPARYADKLMRLAA